MIRAMWDLERPCANRKGVSQALSGRNEFPQLLLLLDNSASMGFGDLPHACWTTRFK
jgi:hypothetical protein